MIDQKVIFELIESDDYSGLYEREIKNLDLNEEESTKKLILYLSWSIYCNSRNCIEKLFLYREEVLKRINKYGNDGIANSLITNLMWGTDYVMNINIADNYIKLMALDMEYNFINANDEFLCQSMKVLYEKNNSIINCKVLYNIFGLILMRTKRLVSSYNLLQSIEDHNKVTKEYRKKFEDLSIFTYYCVNKLKDSKYKITKNFIHEVKIKFKSGKMNFEKEELSDFFDALVVNDKIISNSINNIKVCIDKLYV
ncbi:hypothetical protein C4D39_03330 [Clostridium perfringens]|uniref:hypothetical protein n=1 Tax=Clostridium perfringens TaxID=1502 RepID=UPI0020482EE5|nr:MAG TPA: hypothetical protein [Caudoviricetes sp.]